MRDGEHTALSIMAGSIPRSGTLERSTWFSVIDRRGSSIRVECLICRCEIGTVESDKLTLQRHGMYHLRQAGWTDNKITMLESLSRIVGKQEAYLQLTGEIEETMFI